MRYYELVVCWLVLAAAFVIGAALEHYRHPVQAQHPTVDTRTVVRAIDANTAATREVARALQDAARQCRR